MADLRRLGLRGSGTGWRSDLLYLRTGRMSGRPTLQQHMYPYASPLPTVHMPFDQCNDLLGQQMRTEAEVELE